MADLIEQTIDTVTVTDDLGTQVNVHIIALIDPETNTEEGYDLWEEAGDGQIHVNEGDCLYELPTEQSVQTYYDEYVCSRPL